jgi:hypothetical protein
MNCLWVVDQSLTLYRVCQNSRIPNSERGREGPSGARKILILKKIEAL